MKNSSPFTQLKKQLLMLSVISVLSPTLFAQESIGKIWVTFNNTNDVPTLIDGTLKSSNSEIQQLINQYSILGVEQAISNSRNEDLLKVYEVECLCDADELSSTIERNSTALSQPEIAPKYELLNTPNDYSTVFSNDYALNLIEAESAWNYSTGDPNTIIGISDGNFYTNHEELMSEVINYTPWSTSTYYYQHGTAVAVTAAGSTDNSVGKSSIGYKCKLSLVSMNYNQVLGLTYSGAKVINISWTSGCTFNNYVQAIIDEVYNNGTIIVAAAGNGSTCNNPSNLVYPAAHDNVIAVSSVGPYDNHERTIGNPATTHQHNSSVDICAPGYDVALTIGPGQYMTGNGTSFASPLVTGTIGLMLSANPNLTQDEVLEILSSTATNIDAQNPNYIGLLGAGRLNAGLAVKKAWGLFNSNNNPTDPGNSSGNDDDNGGNVSYRIEPTPNPYTGTINNGTTSGGASGSDGHVNYPTNVGLVSVDPGNNEDPMTEGNTPFDETNESAGSNLGISEEVINQPAFQVNLSPNPTTGSSRIQWNIKQSMILKVIDYSGSLLEYHEITPDVNSIQLDIKDKGIYLVELDSNGDRQWVGKIVKM